MVAVYRYRVWDAGLNRYTTPPVRATAEFIRKAKGEIIPESVEDVEPSLLDEYGRFDSQRNAVRHY